jgi:flagellar biosynthetic protein FliQ
MTIDEAVGMIRQSLLFALFIASPMLLVGLVVGIIISVVQALTQIQEQTLTFVPKIAAMVVSAAILMPWIGLRLVEYTQSMFAAGQVP